MKNYEINGLAHICIYTKDMIGSLDFYLNVLDFTKEYETSFGKDGNETQYILVRNKSCIIELLKPLNSSKDLNTFRGAIDHFALEVKNIEEAVTALKEKDVEFVHDLSEMDNLFNGIKGAFIKGPNGEYIELFEYK